MRYKIIHALMAASTFIATFAAASLWAHHSPSAIFDMAKPMSVTGTLTKIDWINPHILVQMDAQGEGGKVEHWTFESNPPSWYRKVGLARADLAQALGKTVTVGGVRARDGSLFGYMLKIKMPDGTSLELVLSEIK